MTTSSSPQFDAQSNPATYPGNPNSSFPASNGDPGSQLPFRHAAEGNGMAGANPDGSVAQNQAPQQYPAQNYGQGMPNIVINNSAQANAGAAAGAASGVMGGRRRQSVMVHLVLFLCTAGLGNLVYWWYISSWNRKHGF